MFEEMKKLLSYIIVIVSLSNHARAQESTIKDSLLQALQSAKEDTSTIPLLLNIEKFYSNKNYDSFYYYLDKARALAKKLKTDKYDFYINTGFAEYYYYYNDYNKSVEYALRSKEVAERANDYKLLAKSYNNLAAIYNHYRKHRYAIDCILKCLDISEKTKDSGSFPIRNLTASNTYYNLEQFDKSIQYANKAIQFGKAFNNPFAVTMGLNNLSASYSQLNMLDSSIRFSKQQLAFAKQQEDIVNINYALINLCSDNFRAGNVKALDGYSAELARFSKSLPDSQALAEVYDAIAMQLISSHNYAYAKTYLDSGFTIASNQNNEDALGNLFRTYSILYYLQGNIKKGEYYSYRHDSLISAGNLRELNFYTQELETKYETEKKESRIRLQQTQLRQKTNLNYFLTTGAVALLVISLLGYRSYKNRQKLQQTRIEELEKEKQLMAAEAVLKGEEQERSRLAKDLHDGLGGMLSGIKYSLSNMKENLIMTPENAQAFERSLDMLDSSIKEMRRVAHNMMPEMLVKYDLDTALREFCLEIDRSGVLQVSYQSIGMDKVPLDQTVAVTIYRVVQELVNNTMKHAAAKSLLVQLHASETDKLLTLTVEDDGRGFDPSVLKQAQGIGWNNIKNRVEFLKGKIDINTAAGKGTSVLIELNTE